MKRGYNKTTKARIEIKKKATVDLAKAVFKWDREGMKKPQLP